MQMAVTKYHTCWFVVWSKQDIFVEKIPFSESFWDENLQIGQKFHEQIVLPQLLGKYFTRQQQQEALTNGITQSENQGTYL